MIKRNTLAIATISWARDAYEADVLKNSLTRLSQHQLPLFVTDAGSDAEYVQYLKGLDFTTLLGPVKGLVPQTASSIENAYASGAEWIFYTEPDKLHFFADHLEGMLQQIAADDKTGIYIAARSPKGFATFPPFQQMTETTINRCCAELLGVEGDFIYGPFLMHRNLVPHLKKVPHNLGWGWRPYLFVLAQRLGYGLRLFEGDFLCPEDQRQDDRAERIYRMKQLAQNMEGLAAGAAATLPGA